MKQQGDPAMWGPGGGRRGLDTQNAMCRVLSQRDDQSPIRRSADASQVPSEVSYSNSLHKDPVQNARIWRRGGRMRDRFDRRAHYARQPARRRSAR